MCPDRVKAVLIKLNPEVMRSLVWRITGIFVFLCASQITRATVEFGAGQPLYSTDSILYYMTLYCVPARSRALHSKRPQVSKLLTHALPPSYNVYRYVIYYVYRYVIYYVYRHILYCVPARSHAPPSKGALVSKLPTLSLSCAGMPSCVRHLFRHRTCTWWDGRNRV